LTGCGAGGFTAGSPRPWYSAPFPGRYGGTGDVCDNNGACVSAHCTDGIKDSDELILWTFVHAGVRESDPDFQKYFKKMVDGPLEKTYKVALQAMILEELDRIAYQHRIWQCAQFLIDNQCKNGQWNYGSPTEYAQPPAKSYIPHDSMMLSTSFTYSAWIALSPVIGFTPALASVAPITARSWQFTRIEHC